MTIEDRSDTPEAQTAREAFLHAVETTFFQKPELPDLEARVTALEAQYQALITDGYLPNYYIGYENIRRDN